MAKEQFRIEDPVLYPYAILKEKHGGYSIEEVVNRVNKKTGDHTKGIRVVRYPATLESAIKWIVDAKLADKESVLNLKQFLKEYNTLKSEFSELINT